MHKTESLKFRKRELRKKRFLNYISYFKNPFVIIVGLYIGFACISYIGAFYMAIITSLKSLNNFSDDLLGFPRKLMYENYLRAFANLYIMQQTDMGSRRVTFFELLKNSVMISTLPVFFTVFSRALVAYVVAKYQKFRFNKVLHFFVVFVIVFPSAGSLGATISFLKLMGLYDSYFALILGTIGFADSTFLMWYGAWKGIPTEYMEAARIDGAGHWQTYFSVMFPMIRVQFLIFLALNFIDYWNDYSRSLTTMPSYPNLALGLWKFQFSTTNIISWPPVQMAAVVLVALPCIIVFLIVQPHLEGNIKSGGLKG